MPWARHKPCLHHLSGPGAASFSACPPPPTTAAQGQGRTHSLAHGGHAGNPLQSSLTVDKHSLVRERPETGCPTGSKRTLLLGLTKIALRFFVGETEEIKEIKNVDGFQPAVLVGSCRALHHPLQAPCSSPPPTQALHAPRGLAFLSCKHAVLKSCSSSEEGF